MNILTRNFASTRPVQIATWTYKRYNLIVIFASTRPVQIATQCASRTVRVQAFASTRSVQIATFRALPLMYTYGLCLHTPRADWNSERRKTMSMTSLCLHTPRADWNDFQYSPRP